MKFLYSKTTKKDKEVTKILGGLIRKVESIGWRKVFVLGLRVYNKNLNKHTPIVIAGSGPSLANIDYYRVPQKAKIFRINVFFLEDKYYLGKKVDFCLIGRAPFDKFYEIKPFLEKEYKFDTIFSTPLKEYPAILNPRDIIRKNKSFSRLRKAYKAHYKDPSINRTPTSGIVSLFVAYGLGFRNFYIAGYDLYNAGTVYPWDTSLKPGLAQIDDQAYSTKETRVAAILNKHPLQLQIDAIKLLKSLPGVKMYSISQTSPINEYIPLAPKLGVKADLLEDKPENAIKDFLFSAEGENKTKNEGVK